MRCGMTRIRVSDRYWFGIFLAITAAIDAKMTSPAIINHLWYHARRRMSSGVYFRPGITFALPSTNQQRLRAASTPPPAICGTPPRFGARRAPSDPSNRSASVRMLLSGSADRMCQLRPAPFLGNDDHVAGLQLDVLVQ